MSGAYYNENDPKAVAWLRELIRAGLIAPGTVDDRSITDVRPSDLAGYDQCHFFAGIGGWSYALRLAGWPDDRQVWTGSCPCQPFSVAGKRAGNADERHLWPVFRDLIAECRPPVVFGEQVASADGRAWLASVQADVEALGAAFAAADLCAAGVGSPQLRQRLYWAADASGERYYRFDALLRAEENGRQSSIAVSETPRSGPSSGMGNAGCAGLARRSRQQGDDGAEQPATERAGGWSGAEWIDCTDGKARPVEPGSFPLAHGIPARVGRLRGYGNAINPEVAAVFIKAYVQARTDLIRSA